MFATTQIASAEFYELNLDDCIDLALKNNRTIEQSVELRENAKWILKRQRRAIGPSIRRTTTYIFMSNAGDNFLHAQSNDNSYHRDFLSQKG